MSGGTGLGLYISQSNQAFLMGGREVFFVIVPYIKGTFFGDLIPADVIRRMEKK
jgi:hypothetical protein